eukprot:1980081-Amphidinium_carterae.1
MHAQHGWGPLQCWNAACEWAPEIYAGCHRDSFRRWEQRSKLSPKGSRPAKVSPVVKQEMAAMLLSMVATNTPVSTRIACEMMQNKHKIVLSCAWMRRFMLGLVTVQEAQAAQHFLACKTLWLQ